MESLTTELLNKGKHKDFDWQGFFTPELNGDTEKLLEEQTEYERLGMEVQVKDINLRLMALAAEQKGLSILRVQFDFVIPFLLPWGDRNPRVWRILPLATQDELVGPMNITWLKEFPERIPLNVLKKLPTNIDKAVIFHRLLDPIIAIPMYRRRDLAYYLSIFRWR